VKLLKENWRILIRIIGVILVGVALLGAYWWFYKLVPVRNLASPKWRESHSEKAIWSEEQKKYLRTKASPDLCFGGDRIGHYGDKRWFLWLHDQIEKDPDFRACGCTEYVFALIANQTMESRQSWLVTNRNRTQEEWIKDGFAKYNVFPNAPAAPSDFEPLLQLLVKPQWNFLYGGPQGTNAPEAIPSYVQYNAFRWLRDSGFNPMTFTLSNETAVASNNLSMALLKYSQWNAGFPARNELGILSFGSKSDPEGILGPPPISKRSFIVMVNSAIFLSMAGGIGFIALSKKRKATGLTSKE
jgi:hypothetical protein